MDIIVHRHKPLADGMVFDDLWGLDMETRNLLAARGVVFCSEFKVGGKTYAGNIIATSWAAAEEIAFARALGEEIIGVMAGTGLDR
jgi:hypothetical protein